MNKMAQVYALICCNIVSGFC